jgi:rhamnosyltransferase
MRTAAVIVAYNPDAGALRRLCETLWQVGVDVIVVDNTEDGRPSPAVPGAQHLRLGENTGIARALNIGIRLGIDRGAEAIALFDQDSEIGAEYVASLTRHLNPHLPGVVAPVAYDKRTGREYPSVRMTPLGVCRAVYSTQHDEPYAVDLVISSGSLITTPTFAVVGLMDEDFFIDFVDFEWCLRCREHSVPIRVVPSARLAHAIGSEVVSAAGYRGIMHSPERTYYKIRNSFLIFRKPAFPKRFAARQALSAVGHNLVQLLFVANRRGYWSVFIRAVRDGVRGVTGKYIPPDVSSRVG